MEDTTTMISPSELKKLLFAIIEHRLPVGIRYRTSGQLWYPNFLRIVKTHGDRGIIFYDNMRERTITLHDFTRIVQFEVDDKLFSLEASCHYQVCEEIFSED